MNNKALYLLQIILYLLSPFAAFFLATTTSAVDHAFIIMFLVIVLSQWLAIHTLGKLIGDK